MDQLMQVTSVADEIAYQMSVMATSAERRPPLGSVQALSFVHFANFDGVCSFFVNYCHASVSKRLICNKRCIL
jgi:hypothetical protein